MKAHTQYLNSKILPVAIASLAFFCLVSGSGRALGQTNTFPSSGSVGIGTTAPSTSLHVATESTAATRGIVGAQSSTDVNGSMFSLWKSRGTIASPTVVGSSDSIGNIYSYGYDGSSYISGAKLKFVVDGTVSVGTLPTNFQIYTGSSGGGTERMRITSAGNVGIGTTTPGDFLHVRKDQNAATHLTVENTTAGASAYADLQVKNDLAHLAQFGLYSSTTTTSGALAAGNAFAYTTAPAMVIMANNGTGVIKFATGGLGERMRIDATGNVGIGTTTPSDLMQVDTASGWGFRIRYTGDGQYLRLSANQISSFTSAGAGRDLYLNPAGGNVAIGTATPNSNYKLDVNGSANVTGNLNATGAITGGTINAKYQDVAEWVQSSQQLSPGTVVVLDHTRSNQVIASSQAYDTRVAGVISLQPGITLGEDGAGKVLVATTGRVKVRVDATAGPIQVGDLLVTSDIEGVAKKSEPLSLGGVQIHRPGTLIGKALEPLAKGTGEILVLLSLQ